MTSSDFDLDTVRRALEAALRNIDASIPIRLIGTAVDDGCLSVVVQSARDGSIHVVRNDVLDLRVNAEATTLDRLVDELLHRSVNPQDLQLMSRASVVTHEWR